MRQHESGRHTPAILIAAVATFLAAGTAVGAPDGAALARRMKAALEPDRPSVRTLTVTISAEDGEATEWRVGEARKAFPEGARLLDVILAPPDVKGTVYLTHEARGRTAIERDVYLPTVRRVRRVLPIEGFRAFLESDFTLADLGLVGLGAAPRLVGETTRNGVRTFELDEKPTAPEARWYYSRVLTWIATDTSLPVERDFYDPSGSLWKVETLGNVQVIDGVPTVLHLRMDDKQAGGHTEIAVGDVHYGVDLPDHLFDVAHLRDATSWTQW
jgi:outer membrane lipoprotein-sorting protein